jgi:transposase, IS5 family
MRPKQHETSIIRDIRRKIAAFPWSQIRSQQQRQRGWKLYSFHAPEVECIGKGKASAPYEFGVKASIVTTNARAPGWANMQPALKPAS